MHLITSFCITFQIRFIPHQPPMTPLAGFDFLRFSQFLLKFGLRISQQMSNHVKIWEEEMEKSQMTHYACLEVTLSMHFTVISKFFFANISLQPLTASILDLMQVLLLGLRSPSSSCLFGAEEVAD